jgi:hypothetical protein
MENGPHLVQRIAEHNEFTIAIMGRGSGLNPAGDGMERFRTHHDASNASRGQQQRGQPPRVATDMKMPRCFTVHGDAMLIGVRA